MIFPCVVRPGCSEVGGRDAELARRCGAVPFSLFMFTITLGGDLDSARFVSIGRSVGEIG